ncbi:NAD(P)-dependent oxidoreductase [Rouxiella sp. Mn2063]|uniref:NAD(P)-dependent oxidoreductase n=1 Tax=Rouxiella sp. Mn2063 TaxID=3395262 RepID=UPI003BEA7AE6
MSKITVLGLGAMGSRMAANLIAAKHDVTVWNRTPTAAEPLLSQHVTQASSPREAVDGAEFVIAMLRDDAASQQVWLDPHTGALAGMAAGSVAIESSTLTPTWIKALGAQMSHHNVSLLEAPVSGSRPQAEAGQLVYLVGGDADTLQRSRSLLEEMGSSIHHVGALGDGALVKLATNALMGIQVTALAEIIGLLKRHGTDVNKALAAIAGTSVWAPIATYLSSTMLNGNFAPLFPVELIEKDFAYTLSAAGSTGAAPTVAAAHDVFRQALERNLGQENMTSVVKLFTE